MIWEFNSSSMEKPNVDEREFTMGFYMHTIDVLSIFKGVRKQIWGIFHLELWIRNKCEKKSILNQIDNLIYNH
jgi:hypothetical protein